MNAKSATERHKKFLRDGFFAPELPPAFNSYNLSKHRDLLAKKFAALPKKNNLESIYNYTSKPAIFRFPRFLNADQRHVVVNPIGFFALSKLIADNYIQLRKAARKSIVSATPPMFDWEGRRAIKRPSFEVRDQFAEYLAANFECTVTTDISSFYHSVYTHSIPWAIHGKKISKQKKQDNSLIGNLIDRLVRNAQDGQTIGLPVGPDTSRLIAEIVASAIDVNIQEKLKKLGVRGLRLVDDFIVGCTTKSEAEKAIATIRRATNFYELELNSSKTCIIDHRVRDELGWKELIKSYLPKSPYSNSDMKAFFFRIAEIQRVLPTHNILKFAIRNARSALVNAEHWKPTQHFLISAYKQNSTLVDSIVEIFIQRQKLKADVEITELKNFLTSRLPVLGDQLRNGEASWLLYLSRVLQIKINSSSLEPFLTNTTHS